MKCRIGKPKICRSIFAESSKFHDPPSELHESWRSLREILIPFHCIWELGKENAQHFVLRETITGSAFTRHRRRGGGRDVAFSTPHGCSRNFQTTQAQIRIKHIADEHELVGLGFVSQFLQALVHGVWPADDAHCQKVANGSLCTGV